MHRGSKDAEGGGKKQTKSERLSQRVSQFSSRITWENVDRRKGKKGMSNNPPFP